MSERIVKIKMNQENSYAQAPLSPDNVHLILLASTFAQPFAEVFWVTTESDNEIAVLLLNLFSRLHDEKQYERLFELLRILHGVFRIHFGPELLKMQSNPAALKYFLDCFLRDFYEIIDDHVIGIG